MQSIYQTHGYNVQMEKYDKYTYTLYIHRKPFFLIIQDSVFV